MFYKKCYLTPSEYRFKAPVSLFLQAGQKEASGIFDRIDFLHSPAKGFELPDV
jgi:hypothetical protein